MEYIYSEELKHHGILGQKWGVRRYQNEDGTLTAKGKKRQKVLNKIDNKIDQLESKIPKSPWQKDYDSFVKKNGYRDFDDYWEGYSQKKIDSIQSAQDKWDSKYGAMKSELNKLYTDKSRLENDYADMAKGIGTIFGTMLGVPLATATSFIATKGVSDTKLRAGIIAVSAIGTPLVSTAAGTISGRHNIKKTEKKYGI